jgi:hypothetical protein
MRCALRALLLAAILLAAGCSLFRDPDVQVDKITSMDAPDTVLQGARFSVTFTAMLGVEGGYMLDHFEAMYSADQLALRVWSRDTSKGGARPQVVIYRDLTLDVGPVRPGEFHLVAHQPDGRDSLKTITVLP